MRRTKSLKFRTSYLDYNSGDACSLKNYSASYIFSSHFESEESNSDSEETDSSEEKEKRNRPWVNYERWNHMEADSKLVSVKYLDRVA